MYGLRLNNCLLLNPAMTENLMIFLILETIGCILVIVGYLIKYKQKIQLIAGVCKDDDHIIDKKGFASLVGGNVLLSGIIFCTGAVGMYFFPSFKSLIESVLLLSLLFTIILTYTRGKKYIKR